MTTALTNAAIHESSHTRTTVNVDEQGRRVVSMTNSALSMTWRAGELAISHRFSTVPAFKARPAPAARGMRNRL